jgi:hypothetical protein
MDMQVTHSNLGAILSKYPDLSETEKQAIQAQLTQAAEKDPEFWKAVVDYMKEDPMPDISDRLAIFEAIDPTGQLATEIGDRYYSV